jgi:CHAD domain-containing protein
MKTGSSMLFKINHTAPIDLEIKRILTDLIDESLQYLIYSDQNTDECIHEIRKNMKKARATLRLIRPGIPTELYQRFNALFRDIAREFSEARDSRALLDTFNCLMIKHEDSLPLQHASTLVEDNYKNKTSELKKDKPYTTTKAQLDTSRHLTEALKITTGDHEKLLQGLVSHYKKVRKAFKKASQTNDAHEFHEWRKKQKHLLSQFLLLEDFFTSEINYYPKYLDELAGLLGKEHDLAVLTIFLEKSPIPKSEFENLKPIINTERESIQEQCTGIGKKIFHKNLKDFEEELNAHLHNH